MVEQDERIAQPAQGLGPSRAALVEHFLKPDVGRECFTAGYLEATIHEVLSPGPLWNR